MATRPHGSSLYAPLPNRPAFESASHDSELLPSRASTPSLSSSATTSSREAASPPASSPPLALLPSPTGSAVTRTRDAAWPPVSSRGTSPPDSPASCSCTFSSSLSPPLGVLFAPDAISSSMPTSISGMSTFCEPSSFSVGFTYPSSPGFSRSSITTYSPNPEICAHAAIQTM